MLVVTRKPDNGMKSTFRIGKDITVTILAVDRKQVTVGIRAPDDVTILRSELKERK